MACAVAVVVTHQQQVLFGKRKTKSTEFEWQLPGGWIEPGELPEQAARREVLEETGLSLLAPRFVAVTNNLFATGEHSVSLYFEAECVDAGSLKCAESDKCGAWEWHYWDDIAGRLFLPLQLLKKTKYRPFSGALDRTYVSI